MLMGTFERGKRCSTPRCNSYIEHHSNFLIGKSCGSWNKRNGCSWRIGAFGFLSHYTGSSKWCIRRCSSWKFGESREVEQHEQIEVHIGLHTVFTIFHFFLKKNQFLYFWAMVNGVRREGLGCNFLYILERSSERGVGNCKCTGVYRCPHQGMNSQVFYVA